MKIADQEKWIERTCVKIADPGEAQTKKTMAAVLVFSMLGTSLRSAIFIRVR